MTEDEGYQQRKTAIHMIRSGVRVAEVAQRLGRSAPWVYKWRARFKAEGWNGLHSRSRAPKHCPSRLSEEIRQSIRQARSEVEAEAAEKKGLRYIGSGAVRTRLGEKRIGPPPSTASIERVLHDARMTRPRCEKEEAGKYPRLHPTKAGVLCQVDIVPHYLKGGDSVACFNALDVVSRYPTGEAYEHRRSVDAQAFLIHAWQEIGLPKYTQVDNEACFSGGFTHPGVLGKVLRLALYVGTELVFSPVRHPQSNGSVERFHQDYDQHVWEGTHLQDCADVQEHADQFFADYRRSRHHSALGGRSPAEVHASSTRNRLSAAFELPKGRLPLTEGRVHFMRRVSDKRTITLLNLTWSVPDAEPGEGVWATLEFRTGGATLKVYNQAPDTHQRRCLAQHVFPLKEPVHPLRDEFRTSSPPNLWENLFAAAIYNLARARVVISTMF
jgi:transposase/transposase InsO family protein